MRLQILVILFLSAGVASQPASADLDVIASFAMPAPHVDCGGHYAETCTVCPQGHSSLWCNGQCTYVFGECEYTTAWVWFKRQINDLWDLYWQLISLWWEFWPLVLLAGILMAVYAAVYKGKVVDEFPEDRIESRPVEFEDFEPREIGLFDMFKTPNTCLWAFFCTPVLAAKNFEVGKSFAYWPSCVIMFLMYTPLHCIAAIMRTIMSNKLQRNLSHKAGLAEQLITSCCCMCCAVGRESLEVDEAAYMQVKCPFQVEDTYTPLDMFVDRDPKDRSCKERWCSMPTFSTSKEGRTCCANCGGTEEDKGDKRTCGCGS